MIDTGQPPRLVLPVVSGVKKSALLRFSVGQRVQFKVWEGSPVLRRGEVFSVNRRVCEVKVDGVAGLIPVLRSGLRPEAFEVAQ